MRYFLVGFMGVGKTTIGRLVAQALSVPFLDVDQIIEEIEGRTISDIFAKHGESHFRLIEHEALLRAIDQHNDFIMATGGGLPCFFDHMAWMNAQGTTIYLRADVDSLSKRLASKIDHRPVLADHADQLEAYIEKLLAVRGPIYEQAERTIDLDLEGSKQENARHVMQVLEVI